MCIDPELGKTACLRPEASASVFWGSDPMEVAPATRVATVHTEPSWSKVPKYGVCLWFLYQEPCIWFGVYHSCFGTGTLKGRAVRFMVSGSSKHTRKPNSNMIRGTVQVSDTLAVVGIGRWGQNILDKQHLGLCDSITKSALKPMPGQQPSAWLLYGGLGSLRTILAH